jgi:hypothetical protein
LPAIRALNEALHPTLRRSQESALRESHEARRFHNQGQSRHFGSRLFVPARPLLPESDHFITRQRNDALVESRVSAVAWAIRQRSVSHPPLIEPDVSD